MLDKIKKILQNITFFYILTIIVVFPLVVNDTGFTRILEFKYSFFLISFATYFLSIIGLLIYLFIHKINYFKNFKLSKIQIISICLMLVYILSYIFTPFKNANLFLGVGRGEGLLINLVYILSFLFVTIFGKFKKEYILIFSISSILINLIAIIQYIGFNPFNIFQNGAGTHNVSFLGTIGNVDFISAIFCLLLTVSFMAYIFLDENKIVHLISIFMGMFIFGIIDVNSGKVALLFTLILIFPFVILSNKRMSNFLVAMATTLFSYVFNIFINPVYYKTIKKIMFEFQFNYIVIGFIIVILIMLFMSYLFKKNKYDYTKEKKIIKIFYISIIGLGIMTLLIIYLFDFNIGIIHEVHQILHGNLDDKFGTFRLFLWKRTITLIKYYPILGSGPDSFALRFMPKYINDIARIGKLTINDTAANVYLTLLINVGVLGLLNYLVLLFIQLKNGIKRINKYSYIFLVAITCYMVQDFFNLSVVIITPLFWVTMAIHQLSLNEINIIDTKL